MLILPHPNLILRLLRLLPLFFLVATSHAAERVGAAKATLPDFSPGAEYEDDQRMHQGIPSIERARNGRLWVAWYGGGLGEDQHNFIMLATSGDDGGSWSPLKGVIDPDGGGPVRAFDPCLWHDPQERLWFFWSLKDNASTADWIPNPIHEARYPQPGGIGPTGGYGYADADETSDIVDRFNG